MKLVRQHQSSTTISGILANIKATGATAPEPPRGKAFIVLDVSNSMNGNNKLKTAKAGASGFASQALDKSYRVGLIAFAQEAKLICNLSGNLGYLVAEINKLKTNSWTNLADAIELATRELGETGPRSMVLITDGQPLLAMTQRSIDEQTLRAKAAGTAAKNLGIDILTIGTHDADTKLLAFLASRSDLASITSDGGLGGAIVDAARLLPDVSSACPSSPYLVGSPQLPATQRSK